MDDRSRDTIEHLIRRYHLHDRVPVCLDTLLQDFTIREYDLTPRTLGFSLVMRHQVHIGINRTLDSALRRLTLAHECGHLISFHPGMNYTCERNTWFKSKLEHEAQIVAAYLLVPKLAAICYGEQLTAQQLAARLDVPISLVDLRWSQGVISGEI